mmetsp:Transcript_51992/g.160195  ORF Transcript_51992/g.160195 Transcript_51992/m.160195 type:complete len:250 (+) Transcript_51992:892-1641(+)
MVRYPHCNILPRPVPQVVVRLRLRRHVHLLRPRRECDVPSRRFDPAARARRVALQGVRRSRHERLHRQRLLLVPVQRVRACDPVERERGGGDGGLQLHHEQQLARREHRDALRGGVVLPLCDQRLRAVEVPAVHRHVGRFRALLAGGQLRSVDRQRVQRHLRGLPGDLLDQPLRPAVPLRVVDGRRLPRQPRRAHASVPRLRFHLRVRRVDPDQLRHLLHLHRRVGDALHDDGALRRWHGDLGREPLRR